MEDFLRLVLLSLAMFVGCYLSGSIPLALTLSEGVFRKVTTFGAGLLIGTALIIIIPEGVESLFSGAIHSKSSHVHTHISVLTPASNLPVLDTMRPDPEEAAVQELPLSSVSMETSEGLSEEQLQMIMGASLTIGFIFMLLVDQLGGHAHSSDVENGGVTQKRNRLTATIGLVVHAAADGLALGAAAGLRKVEVELIIFLAIMLHKAPAAFGFTSFLILEGHDRYSARKHLLAFALAAPVAAFLSYFGLVRIMYTVQLPITGVAMLFSAGTFLYVATVHVLTEITQNSHQHSHTSDLGASSSSAGSGSSSKLSKAELLLVVAGALFPLLFNVIHSHSH